MALNDAWRTIEDHLSAIKALKDADTIEAVSARWRTVVVLKTIMADEFI